MHFVEGALGLPLGRLHAVVHVLAQFVGDSLLARVVQLEIIASLPVFGGGTRLLVVPGGLRVEVLELSTGFSLPFNTVRSVIHKLTQPVGHLLLAGVVLMELISTSLQFGID